KERFQIVFWTSEVLADTLERVQEAEKVVVLKNLSFNLSQGSILQFCPISDCQLLDQMRRNSPFQVKVDFSFWELADVIFKLFHWSNQPGLNRLPAKTSKSN